MPAILALTLGHDLEIQTLTTAGDGDNSSGFGCSGAWKKMAERYLVPQCR